MPKHLIIDGFNVIRRDTYLSGIEAKNFYGAQSLLLERLARYRSGTAHQITVVFDGRNSPNEHRSRNDQQGVKVIYSARGETADDVIRDLVAKAPARDQWTVVTADRDLAHSCRTLGVAIADPSVLIQRTQPSPSPAPGTDGWHGKREETGWSGSTHKRGNPRRLPKNRRTSRSLW
jgi:predicted RNA-binding protein with PIN domain